MPDVPVCPECRVPNQFVDSHLWLSGGTVVQSIEREHHMVLIECANLDPLFKGIEEIIGTTIERVVIETKRRDAREYIDRLIPDEVKVQVRSHEISVVPLIESLNIVGHVLGYGDSQLIEVVYDDGDDDFVLQHITLPYSILMWGGDLAGSSAAVTGKNHDVSYRQLSEEIWELRAWPSPEPEELQDRLQRKEYRYVEGDIELERCPTCGGPSALSGYRWDTEKGLIEMASNGRRVAMLGSAYIESIFDELEKELGEGIPGAVVEAQRRYSTTGVYSPEEIGTEEEFRKLLALRGFGDLQEMKMDKGGLKLRLQNAALHLMIAGLIQGYFEEASGTRSNIEWELKEDGTLELEITPK